MAEPDLPPPAPDARAVLPRTVGAMGRFGLAGLWGALVTVPMSVAQIVTHRRTPTTANFKRWATRWAKAVLAAAGVRVHLVDHARLDPARPYVFVPNHQTALDILVLAAAMPYPFGFAAKAELKDVPFLGHAIAGSPSVFVDKRDARRAVETIREAAARIREGMSVLIFPEGLRTYSGGLDRFERGAFVLAVEAGVPLVPVSIHGAYRLMDERRGLLRAGEVTVVVHDALPTEGLTRRDVPALMAQVHTRLRDDLAAYEAAHPPPG